jgi:hypothetical protein
VITVAVQDSVPLSLLAKGMRRAIPTDGVDNLHEEQRQQAIAPYRDIQAIQSR